MAVITISRQMGSLGNQIARTVADKLGYEYIEKSKISELLSNQGFSASDIESYDEKKPTIWQNLSKQKKRFSLLIRAAVYELAARGNVLIVGRGGQAILKDFPEVLHVRVIAPYATRTSRLMAQMGCDQGEAEKKIRQTDHESSGYISAYFDADWNDGNLYDLVINTRTLSLDTAEAMIISAIGTRDFKHAPQAFEKFNDLALTKKTQAALLEIPGSRETALSVKKGVANLSGFVKSPETKAECGKAVSNIKGITKVNNQIEIFDHPVATYDGHLSP